MQASGLPDTQADQEDTRSTISDAHVAVTLDSEPEEKMVKPPQDYNGAPTMEVPSEEPRKAEVSWAMFATTTSLLSCVAIVTSVIAVSSLRAR